MEVFQSLNHCRKIFSSLFYSGRLLDSVCAVLPLLSRWRSCRWGYGLSLQRPSSRQRSLSCGDWPPDQPQHLTSSFPTWTTSLRHRTRSLLSDSPSPTSSRPMRFRRAVILWLSSEKMSYSSPAPPTNCRATCCSPGKKRQTFEATILVLIMKGDYVYLYRNTLCFQLTFLSVLPKIAAEQPFWTKESPSL